MPERVPRRPVERQIPYERGIDLEPHYPWHIIHEGYTVLVTSSDGVLEGRGRTGLYDFDTRILSGHRLTIDGRPPQYVSGGVIESNRWAAALRVLRPGGDADGPVLPEDNLEVRLTRRVGRGMEERVRVSNHGMMPVEAWIELALAADFADIHEVERGRLQRGETRVEWNADRRTLRFDYRATRDGRSVHRGLRVRIVGADSGPEVDGRTLRFPLRMAPHATWQLTLRYESLVDRRWREPLAEDDDGRTARDRIRERWRARRTRVETDHPVIGPAFERAAEDLFALRNWEYDVGRDAWFTNAGVPTYCGMFGRDSLTAAWQGGLLGPEMMRGALAAVAGVQAAGDSAWRDEEPGKMIHEIRRGPLSELNITPHRAYYGTHTTPAMFVLALSEYWHWTGDAELLRRYRDAALRTFEWAAYYGDRDGDGFLEYAGRSPRGLANHAWKDSDEAIRYPDGRRVDTPIATVEEQAYHFIALQRMAEVLLVLGEDGRAEAFLERAEWLRRRWDDAFWVEDDGFYAMALDPDKRPVRSIGSNPGHALATGIVPAGRARALADRLLAPDLFSGWGVRTLSGEHPSFNPWGYHLGTVWPVENATFALGMKRYGLDDHADRIITGLFAASVCFHRDRLPEALGGDSSDESPVPTAYPKSNSPQAWSASATVQLVQVMLGLYPFAPARLLALVRPRLPEWMRSLTLRRLRVGRSTVSIRFERGRDGRTGHEVIDRTGPLAVVSVPPPQDTRPQEGGGLDGLKRLIMDHAPGRTARALRIALGLPP